MVPEGTKRKNAIGWRPSLVVWKPSLGDTNSWTLLAASSVAAQETKDEI